MTQLNLPGEFYMWVAGEQNARSPGWKPLFAGDYARMIGRGAQARGYGREAQQPVRLVRCTVECDDAPVLPEGQRPS